MPAGSPDEEPPAEDAPEGEDGDEEDEIAEAREEFESIDKDGDGFLQYHEFMTMLQSTTTSVLTQVMSKNEC